jgi:hypothetical protein
MNKDNFSRTNSSKVNRGDKTSNKIILFLVVLAVGLGVSTYMPGLFFTTPELTIAAIRWRGL